MAKSDTESEPMSANKFAVMMIGIFLLIMVFFISTLYYANRAELVAWEREKQCYRVLTDIVRQSSTADAEWIKKTVFAEKGALSRASFCTVLEFVQASGLQQPKRK